MSRLISDKHASALVASWSFRLRGQRWGQGRIEEDVSRLASLLGLDLGASTSSSFPRAKDAVVELRAALLQAEQAVVAAEAVDLLASWIHARLLTDGDSLLISKERRRRLLAQGRDEERRQENAGRGLRSARIELHDETWRQLGELRTTLAPVGKKRLTQNHAVALLIGDRFKAVRASVSRATKALPVEPEKQSLFPPGTLKRDSARDAARREAARNSNVRERNSEGVEERVLASKPTEGSAPSMKPLGRNTRLKGTSS